MAGPLDLDYHRLEASTTAAEAVRLDREGRDGYVAAQLYDKAAEHLSSLVDITEYACPQDRFLLETKIDEYKQRAAALRTAMLARELPDVPISMQCEVSLTSRSMDGENAPTVQNNFKDSKISDKTLDPGASSRRDIASVAADGFKAAASSAAAAAAACESAREFDKEYGVSSTICQVGNSVGATAVSAYQTAKSLEEDYHVSGKVVGSVKTAVSTAQQIEGDYQVTKTLSEAARNAARLAADYEQRYQIQQRLAVLMQDSWQSLKAMGAQAAEYDRQYQLSERAGAALMEGLATVTELAKDASASGWSPSSYFSPNPTVENKQPVLPPNVNI